MDSDPASWKVVDGEEEYDVSQMLFFLVDGDGYSRMRQTAPSMTRRTCVAPAGAPAAGQDECCALSSILLRQIESTTTTAFQVETMFF